MRALTCLCLSPEQASRQWYVARHAHQAPGLRVNWQTGCLTDLQLDFANISLGNVVYSGLQKVKIHTLKDCMYSV